MIQNLEYYKVFYYVAVSGSVTQAAKELSISQPAVSQSLKNLEESLGIPLFIRTARGVSLTQEGEVLFGYISRGYETMELGEKRLRQMLNMESGEIHIGASDMTLRFYLLPFLEKFHQICPGIRIVVSNAPTPETLESLRHGKIDFGVVSTPFQEEGLNCRKVREIEDIFVAAKSFSAYEGSIHPLKDLEKLPLIFLEKDTSSRRYVDQFMEANGVELTPEFELATSDMIVQFACRGLGVGNVVRDFAQEQMEKGQLFEVKFESAIPRRHFCVVTAKDGYLSVAARKLLELMEEPRY